MVSLVYMPKRRRLPPNTEKRVLRAIEGKSYQDQGYTFEEFCFHVLSRSPDYMDLRRSSTSSSRPAPPRNPDAYMNRADGSVVYFEFTEDSNPTRYAHKLMERPYLSAADEVVLAVQATLSLTQRERIEERIKGQDTAARLMDATELCDYMCTHAPSLIGTLLGVRYLPEHFSSLEDACGTLNRRKVRFPTWKEMVDETIFIDDELSGSIQNYLEHHRVPVLLSGRWGSGKSVLAMGVGARLQEKGFSTYYISLSEISEESDWTAFVHLKNEVEKFGDAHTLFIVDDAHSKPEVSYQITNLLRGSGMGPLLLLVGRPTPKEPSEVNTFYPALFDWTDGTIGLTDTPPKGIRMANPFETWSGIWRALDAGDSVDGVRLFARCGGNLSLLSMVLARWNKERGSVLKVKLRPILDYVRTRFLVDEFPQVKTIAALACLDCQADLSAVFINQPGSRRDFAASIELLTESGSSPLIVTGGKATGIGPGEGLLILRSAQHGEGEDRVYSILLEEVLRYARSKPRNPYELIRAMWCTTSDSSGHFLFRDAVRELLIEVLTQEDFARFLKDTVLPNAPSALKLARLARLCSHVGLAEPAYSQLLDKNVLVEMLKTIRQTCKEKGYTVSFTNREYWAWKELARHSSELGDEYLALFTDRELQQYGKLAPRNLGKLVEICARSEVLRERLGSWILDSLGSPGFASRIFRESRCVGAKFLLRDLHRLGDEYTECVRAHLVPSEFARIMKEWTVVDGGILPVVGSKLGKDYRDDVSRCLGLDYLNTICYEIPLNRIRAVYDRHLWARFLAEALARRIDSASFLEVQLFLRNMLFNNFYRSEILAVCEVLDELSIQEGLIAKAVDYGDIGAIGRFLRMLHVVAPRTGSKYAQGILDAGNDMASSEASLWTLTQYAFGLWLSLAPGTRGYLPCNLQERLEAATALGASVTIVTFAGFVRAASLDDAIAFSIDSTDRLGEFTIREIGRMDLDSRSAGSMSRHLWLALSVSGLQHLGISPDRAGATRVAEPITRGLRRLDRRTRALISSPFLPVLGEQVNLQGRLKLCADALEWFSRGSSAKQYE